MSRGISSPDELLLVSDVVQLTKLATCQFLTACVKYSHILSHRKAPYISGAV